MKKIMQVAVLGLAFASGVAMAEKVRDWKDLEKVHKHVEESINEMARARAEELLKQAEHELHDAIEAAKAAK